MDTNVVQRCHARGLADRRTGRFSLAALPPLIRLRWGPRIAIDRDDIARVGSALAAAGSTTLPLLVEVTKLEEISWEARAAILAHDLPARVAVLGEDAVDLVLTAFLVRARAEVRFFTERDEAETWLLRG
ncbi:hypothetical protein [Arthrobacter antioxidans]|uniref:hypothetical protein n=1 Tax=Arthrobacter antioxidans TaxID=2895818 RepID=UPI001FFFA02A|nr:hypothetical protein [Arthrobacter antioxidans]